MQPTEQPLRRPWALTLLFAAALLVSFAFQYRTARVADWQLFAFYDPGTTLKGEWLLRQGMTPTIDFGYTHGLLSLLYGRIGFAILGLTPHAFLILTLLTELVMAYALFRLFTALKLGWPSIVFFLAALPIAIMPAYLTLTHPLEAMLILLALASHADGKHSRALALMTACLFVKPSMAYVYGFVLILLIAHRHWRDWRTILRSLIPATITLITIVAALCIWTGPRPVIATLIPITGATTYAKTNFGFFSQSGRAFWLPTDPWQYLTTPTGIWLIAAIAAAIGALYAAICLRVPRVCTQTLASSAVEPSVPPRRLQLLLTLGILHTAFVLGFYGWTGSWSYYSYLPLLAVCILIQLVPQSAIRWSIAAILLPITLLAHGHLGAEILMAKWKEPTPSGLWAYPAQLRELETMLAIPAGRPTLVMTIGWPPNLPPHAQLPSAWFPEPGIPTASEIARVKAQAQAADYVLVWNQYATLDLWNSPEFTDVRQRFEAERQGEFMTLLRRKP